MAQDLTADFFEALAGKTFSVQPAGTLELVSITRDTKDPRIEGFSLLFHGPKASALGQATYNLQADGVEAMDIFLVPLGPSGEVMRYQAIFSRILG